MYVIKYLLSAFIILSNKRKKILCSIKSHIHMYNIIAQTHKDKEVEDEEKKENETIFHKRVLSCCVM